MGGTSTSVSRRVPKVSSSNKNIKLFNKVSQIFQFSILKFFFSEIRLEFNQSHLKYHTSLDAVLLGGYEPKRILQQHVLQNDLLHWNIPTDDDEDNSDNSPKKQMTDANIDENCDYFSRLPVNHTQRIF